MKALKDWWSGMDLELKSKINYIEILKAFFFGPRVGLLSISVNTDFFDDKTRELVNGVPGFCLIRGNAVAILVVLECTETKEKFTILTTQPRMPNGRIANAVECVTKQYGCLRGENLCLSWR